MNLTPTQTEALRMAVAEECGWTRIHFSDDHRAPNHWYGEPPASWWKDPRLVQMDMILDAPQHYKVCEGCGSIVTARSSECPNCNAYNFDALEVRMIAAAKKLGSRPAESVQREDLK